VEIEVSSTYSLKKHATALVDRHTQTIFYVLSEETTESNVHPRTGHWSTFFMGTAQQCMKRVVEISESCEGGMLTGPGGRHIKPESYIRQWRAALESPTSTEERVIEIRFGEGFYDVPEKTRAVFERLAAEHGVSVNPSGTTALISCDPGVLQLVSAFTLVARREGGQIWKIFRSAPIHGASRPDLGYKVTTSRKVDVLGNFSVLKMPEQPGCTDASHLLVASGQVISTGWSYSTVGEYIRRFASEHEVALPGSAEASIREFRKVLERAASIPATMTVLIKRGVPSGDGSTYLQQKFDALASALGFESGCEEFRTTVVKACSVNDGRALYHLDENQVSFEVPPEVRSTEVEKNAAQADLLLV
jgi:hypothetical protein